MLYIPSKLDETPLTGFERSFQSANAKVDS